ncbi:hypothetical protein OG613_48525 (plasmid) [Streptomyces sp. NBC_00015]|uniref:hypothetical protein n=1 Tax=Streptomyces sp. NBC_00015 TaxID=2903611 RepID=UPI002F9158C8
MSVPSDTVQPASAVGESGRGLPAHVAAQPLGYGPEWLRLVAAADEQLLLLDQAPQDLSQFSRQLHESTGGLVGVLGPALRRAAADATGTTEKLTWQALEHVLTST